MKLKLVLWYRKVYSRYHCENCTLKLLPRAIFLLVTSCCLLVTALCGCEAFRKKFVRKPKRKREVRVVIETQEYKSELSVKQTYKKYYLFWRAWYDELINALSAQDGNRKKLLSSAKKIIENLEQMQRLLLPEAQTRLDVFILEQKDILQELDGYKLNRGQGLRIKSLLEKQRRQLQRDFHYKDIQEYLIKE